MKDHLKKDDLYFRLRHIKKISSILVKDEDLSPEVVAFSSVETSGIKTGSIINIRLISEDISRSINELEDKSGEKIKDIIVSFSGEQISSINSTGSVIIRQEVTALEMFNLLLICLQL